MILDERNHDHRVATFFFSSSTTIIIYMFDDVSSPPYKDCFLYRDQRLRPQEPYIPLARSDEDHGMAAHVRLVSARARLKRPFSRVVGSTRSCRSRAAIAFRRTSKLLGVSASKRCGELDHVSLRCLSTNVWHLFENGERAVWPAVSSSATASSISSSWNESLPVGLSYSSGKSAQTAQVAEWLRSFHGGQTGTVVGSSAGGSDLLSGVGTGTAGYHDSHTHGERTLCSLFENEDVAWPAVPVPVSDLVFAGGYPTPTRRRPTFSAARPQEARRYPSRLTSLPEAFGVSASFDSYRSPDVQEPH